MSERRLFTAMLERAGIGHGLRDDGAHGMAVLVEEEESDSLAEFQFDTDGNLQRVFICEEE